MVAAWVSRVAVTTALSSAVLLAVGQASASPGGQTDHVKEPIMVRFVEYAIEPAEHTLVANEASFLRLVNDGLRRHNLVVLVDGVEVSSPDVRGGDAADWLLGPLPPGRYQYWCGEYRHLEKGMAGAFVVE